MLRRFGFVLALLAFSIAPAPVYGQELDVVAKHRARFSTPLLPEDAQPMLRAIAAELNTLDIVATEQAFGLLRKTSGNHCGGFSCDIICNANDGRHWDVLIDGPDAGGNAPRPGRAESNWEFKGVIDKSRCEVVPPNGPIDPCPNGCPPKPDDLKQLLEQLRASLDENSDTIRRLWEFLGGMHRKLLEIERQNHELRQQLDDLKARPIEFPEYSGRVLGFAVTLRPKRD